MAATSRATRDYHTAPSGVESAAQLATEATSTVRAVEHRSSLAAPGAERLWSTQSRITAQNAVPDSTQWEET